MTQSYDFFIFAQAERPDPKMAGFPDYMLSSADPVEKPGFFKRLNPFRKKQAEPEPEPQEFVDQYLDRLQAEGKITSWRPSRTSYHDNPDLEEIAWDNAGDDCGIFAVQLNDSSNADEISAHVQKRYDRPSAVVETAPVVQSPELDDAAKPVEGKESSPDVSATDDKDDGRPIIPPLSDYSKRLLKLAPRLGKKREPQKEPEPKVKEPEQEPAKGGLYLDKADEEKSGLDTKDREDLKRTGASKGFSFKNLFYNPFRRKKEPEGKPEGLEAKVDEEPKKKGFFRGLSFRRGSDKEPPKKAEVSGVPALTRADLENAGLLPRLAKPEPEKKGFKRFILYSALAAAAVAGGYYLNKEYGPKYMNFMEGVGGEAHKIYGGWNSEPSTTVVPSAAQTTPVVPAVVPAQPEKPAQPEPPKEPEAKKPYQQALDDLFDLQKSSQVTFATLYEKRLHDYTKIMGDKRQIHSKYRGIRRLIDLQKKGAKDVVSVPNQFDAFECMAYIRAVGESNMSPTDSSLFLKYVLKGMEKRLKDSPLQSRCLSLTTQVQVAYDLGTGSSPN